MVDHIKDLVPDPKNARAHTARNLGMIEDGLREVGAARSIVIDENNIILAGNGVVEAAAAAGITNVRVIEAEGDELIAVQRKGLTPEQKTRLALFDNRTADLSGWDLAELSRLASEEPSALEGLWHEDELLRDLHDLERRANAYTPNFHPDGGGNGVSPEELAKEKARLANAYKNEQKLKPLFCPHCGGEFYAEDDADDPGG